ncbi:cellulose binding domain-containing protein [Nocardiopsis dassonvillei]|uniref:cellulose binding domain-containing protein n=1 Tax=Nocardiopsis dassonvillei TaxID=2014 RepID=UPI003629FC55
MRTDSVGSAPIAGGDPAAAPCAPPSAEPAGRAPARRRPGRHRDRSAARGTVANASHNAVTAPGASAGIGYRAAHTGDSGAPTGFALNGAACSPA